MTRDLTDVRAARERAVTARDVDVFAAPSSPDGGPLTVETIEDGLAEAGDRIAVAEALLRDARADAKAWAAAAEPAGVETVRTANLAGVARAAIYQWRGQRG